MPFSATGSPFIAVYTSHQAVSEAKVGEKAVNTAKKKIDVDDYLRSARKVDDGLKEAFTVR